MNLPKAVLFDLDDTLYDHLHSARHGLLALRQRYPAMQNVSAMELEDRYSLALEEIHLRLLRNEVTQTQARTIRMQKLFGTFQIQVSDDQAFAEYKQFRRDYDAVCQCVVGAKIVLDRLRRLGVRMAVVTNNLVSEQIPKLRQLDIENYFDVVSISEEVGVSKPDPKIFEVTLDRLGLSANDVVMVGDSLTSDIAGAQNVGIRAIWINRRPHKAPPPPPEIEIIERDFAEHDTATSRIVGSPLK